MLYPLVKNSQIRPLDIWMNNVTVLLICSQELFNWTNLQSGDRQKSKSGYCTRLSWMWLIEDGISFSYFCVLSRHVQSEGWRLAEPDPRESKQHDATSPWPHPQSLNILKVAMAAQPVSTGLVQQRLCQDASIVVGRPPCGQASFAGRKSKRRRYLPAKTLHRICIVWPFGRCDQFWFFFLVVRSQNISGQPQALALAGFCATWLSHCRKQGKTVQHAAAALKRIVKEDTKTKTASTRDLWGVIIRAPIQQFRWKFWKPVNRPESPWIIYIYIFNHVLVRFHVFSPHVRHSYFVLFLSVCVQDLFHSGFVPLDRHQISKSHCISSLVCIMHNGTLW